MAVTVGSGLSGYVLLWGNMERVQEGRRAPMVWRMAAPPVPHGFLQPLLRRTRHSPLLLPSRHLSTPPPVPGGCAHLGWDLGDVFFEVVGSSCLWQGRLGVRDEGVPVWVSEGPCPFGWLVMSSSVAHLGKSALLKSLGMGLEWEISNGQRDPASLIITPLFLFLLGPEVCVLWMAGPLRVSTPLPPHHHRGQAWFAFSQAWGQTSWVVRHQAP